MPTGFAGVESPAWARLPGTPRPELLEHEVETLPGVGPALSKKLAKLGLRTLRDLVEHRPHRYEPAVPERRIADLLAEEETAISGQIGRVSVRRPRRNLAILQARVSDGSGEITAVWFNQAWLEEKLKPGTRVRLRGQLKRNGFQVRSYDLNGVAATADFAPVYPASEEVTPKRLRGLVARVLPTRTRPADPLPAELKAREALPLRADALVALHRPRSEAQGEEARRRLAFDELLVLQARAGARTRVGHEAEHARPLGEPGELTRRYRDLLPFELTPRPGRTRSARSTATWRGTPPMHRLLQGDVGSGKTVVALYALSARGRDRLRRGADGADRDAGRAALPHRRARSARARRARAALLTSPGRASGARDRRRRAPIVVGTHALIQEDVDFAELGLVVVDEQHRFGVEQRAALRAQARRSAARARA